MKKNFKSILLSLLMAVLMIFQPLANVTTYALGTNDNSLGTVKVIVGDHTTRPDKVLNSKSPRYKDYKQPFGDIVSVNVPIENGDTMYDAIRKALATKGIKCNTTGKGTSVYIASIGPVTSSDGKRTVDKLGEFDGGQMSGWMGSLNDWYVNMGFGNFKVTDGDIVDMEYTSQGLGKDLGQWWDTDNQPDTSLKSVQVTGGKLNKEFSSSVKDYIINVPEEISSIQFNQTATNKANNAQIFAGGKSYKRFQDIPASDGEKIDIYCGKSLNEDLKTSHTIYTFTINKEKPVPKVETPVIKDASITLQQGTTFKNGDLSQYVSSGKTESTKYTVVNDAKDGSLVLKDNGTFSYTPKNDFSGKDSFTYKAMNGNVSSSTASVYINVTPVRESLSHVSDKSINDAVNGIVNWYKNGNAKLMNDNFLQCAGTTAGDWLPIGAARYGISDDYQSYLNKIADYVTEKYKTTNKLDKHKATEWERIALAVGAVGGDPTKIGRDANGNPVNLIADGTYNSIVDYDRQGINAYVFGLIALDSRNYTVPKGAEYTRDDIIKGILSNQMACGGFRYGQEGGSDGEADPDMTAMVVQSLAPYYNSDKTYTYTLGDKTIGEKTVTKTVKQVVDEALESIRCFETEDGDFKSWGVCNAESTDQVIVALCSLGIDPEKDERFITTSGKTPLDGLMKYVMKDGGIAHTIETGSNPMATDQTLYTLAAVKRQRAGMNRLYDYTDVKYIASPVLITSQPENESLNEGQSFTLSVEASSEDEGVLSYQWYKDGKEIEGANSAKYTVNNAKNNDSGSYYVIVTNTFNDAKSFAVSQSAQVTVSKDEPKNITNIYKAERDLKTGISSVEIPVSDVKKIKDENIDIQLNESKIDIKIPKILLSAYSNDHIRFEEKDSNVSASLPNKNVSLCTPIDLSLSVIDQNGNVVDKISQFKDKLVTISFSIDKKQLEGIDLNSLKLFYYDSASGWQEVSKAEYDSKNGAITASTPHFSTFVITGEKNKSNTDNQNTGGNGNSSNGQTGNNGTNGNTESNGSANGGNGSIGNSGEAVSQAAANVSNPNSPNSQVKISANNKKLPKTGTFIDTKVLAVIGISFIAAGVFILLRRKYYLK